MPDSLIKNRKFLTQVKDFSNLRFGSIYPTDIDGFIDFKNKLFVFIEAKFGTSALKGGQRLALERLCDSCQGEHRDSFVIVASHDSENDIDISSAIVTIMRHKNQWKQLKKKITVKEVIIQLLRRYN